MRRLVSPYSDGTPSHTHIIWYSGNKNAISPPPPFSIFKKDDLEDKIVCLLLAIAANSELMGDRPQSKLTSEIEEMNAKAAARQQAASAAANEIADVSMEGPHMSDPIAI